MLEERQIVQKLRQKKLQYVEKKMMKGHHIKGSSGKTIC